MAEQSVKKNTGMTAIELIIVIGIFSVMSTVSVFNYGKFEAKVSIKNLANDLALKIVEAQKSSLAGKLHSAAGANWKPSYGLYFNVSNSTKFIYFVDLDNSNTCTGLECIPPYSIGGEVIDIISITKNNSIPVSGLEVSPTPPCSATIPNLTLVFRRPNTSPIISSSSGLGCPAPAFVSITVTSPQSLSAKVKLYASGRVQIN